jgi:aminoglycoside phosphotransferase (APT) family kinase protein
LQAAFPELDLSALRIVDVGFGSTVVETGQGIIVRVGRTRAAARGHEVEARCLPILAPTLPAPVPVPHYFCPPGPTLPFGAIAYRKLPGHPCRPDTATSTTARDLGAFLATLHRTDSRAFPAMPGPDDVWGGWLKLRHEAQPVLQHRLTHDERARLSRWWERFLADRRMRQYEPAVRHGDMWYGNALIRSDGSVTAVLDWEAVAIADPAEDLAMIRYLGSQFMAAAIDECVAKLRAGPILS